MFIFRISLGNGWYQITPAETGFTSQFGLHSLITTTNGKSFGCIFEPRTEECFNSCFGSTPSYDLEVYLKSMKTDIVSNGLFDGTMQVLLAFKNFNDHVSLICDVVNKVWYLVRISGEHEIIFGEMSDLALKHNTFLHILIQIRGNSVTVDVNGNPIFTHVKLVEGSNFSGYPGIKSKVRCSMYRDNVSPLWEFFLSFGLHDILTLNIIFFRVESWLFEGGS